MVDQSTYKKILAYVDQLNADVSQLTVLIEGQMKERGFESLPSAANKIYWSLSSNYDAAANWRLPFGTRVFVNPGGNDVAAERVELSVFYQVQLDVQTAFEFPTVICGRMRHASMTEREVYDKVFRSWQFKTLAYEKSDWQPIEQVNGWSCVKPKFNSPITELRGFILNLFDLKSPQGVLDNIVAPLTQGDGNSKLAELLTVRCYPFFAS